MDPAEEVLLDPALVNPIFLFASKDSYSCANRPVCLIRRRAPSAGEVNADQPGDTGRRHSLAECENRINRGSQIAIKGSAMVVSLRTYRRVVVCNRSRFFAGVVWTFRESGRRKNFRA
jgi:hypothetical protein